MLKVKAWWLLSGKRAVYYSFALVLFADGILWVVTAKKTLPVLIGLSLMSFGLYFLKLSLNMAKPLPKQSFPQNHKNFINRFISVGSGTYNESLTVQGDYIQGNQNTFNSFNFNQDVSGAIGEIRQLIKQVETEIGDTENAQQKIIDDLALLIYDNSELKSKLHDWLNSLGFASPADEFDAAEKIVGVATKVHCKPHEQLVPKLDKQLRRLKYLLRTAQWRKADDETVRVVKNFMPDSLSRHGCTTIDVHEIPHKQLRAINRLWLEASDGRFGFSVQKEIWIKIQKAYRYQSKYDLPVSEYDAFVKAVGWSNDQSRIYHVDFDYLITNPSGHLPAKILLWEGYNPGSNYCYLSSCLFDDFMEREYSDVPYLPAWLRRWLLLG